MLPENLVIAVVDVLNYQQKHEKMFVPARSFCALSLRFKTSGKYISKGKTYPFKPVSVCIIPAGVNYTRHTHEEEIAVIHFKTLNYVMDEIQVFNVVDGEKYKDLFAKALTLKYKNKVGASYKITSIVYDIFSELTQDIGFSVNQKDNRIVESADYIHRNFGNSQLSINELSKKACVSPAYYRREFNRVYGSSPKEYLDSIRIQYAKSLLETRCFSQKEIALRCGYSDVVYFRTAFKNKTGKSITQFLSKK